MMIVDSLVSAALLAATLTVEVRQPVDDSKRAQLVEWVEATAETIKLVYGRSPNPEAKIIVIPSAENARGSDAAVIFGRVTRHDDETIELFVRADRPIADFYADWTATHEFSHLLLPQLGQRAGWISEGFATYYQNILMVRAGRYTEAFAWQRLTEGFERGRKSRPELSLNDAASAGIRNARMKIYWSGAVIALMADTELRKRSGGVDSLDSVLGDLQQCCLPSRRLWSGPRLFEKLDSFLDTPVFMPLYRQHANEQGFPNVTPVLSDLGVVVRDDGSIRFDADAPSADIRKSMSAPR